MKSYPCFTALLSFPLILLLVAYTSGPPAGHTGSPLDGQDCTACHLSLPPGHLPGWITTDIPDDGYTAGETYTVTFTAVIIVGVKLGFQITAETETEKAGTFIITDDTRTQLADQHTVTHTTAGTVVTSLPCAWSMDWQAPPEGTGDVTFYGIINHTNNQSNSSGDSFYASEITVKEATVGIAENAREQMEHIFPNPADESIYVDAPMNSEIRICNLEGVTVKKFVTQHQPSVINVSNLGAGVYLIHILSGEKQSAIKFVKR